MPGDNDEGAEDKVVPLPSDYVPQDAPTSSPGLLHGIATIAMAIFAIVGFLAMFAFITVGWPGDSGRYVIVVVVLAGVGFLASAAIAVLAAARDTYAGRSITRERNSE